MSFEPTTSSRPGWLLSRSPTDGIDVNDQYVVLSGSRTSCADQSSQLGPIAVWHPGSCEYAGLLSSPSRTSTNSANRGARAPGAGPSTVASKPDPPAPTPSVNRPFDTWSRVIASFARVTGCRKFGEATMVPSRMAPVTPATPVSHGIAACHGRSRYRRQDRWS